MNGVNRYARLLCDYVGAYPPRKDASGEPLTLLRCRWLESMVVVRPPAWLHNGLCGVE